MPRCNASVRAGNAAAAARHAHGTYAMAEIARWSPVIEEPASRRARLPLLQSACMLSWVARDGGRDMRFGAVLGTLAFVLAGCVTATNKLPLEQIADLRVGEVSVSIADDAQVAPELRAVVSPKVKAVMERQLSPRLKGSIPVRVEMNVRSVRIVSEVETVLVGGTHGMTADVTRVDPRTKAVLLTYDAQSNNVGGGAGVAGLIVDRAVLPHPIDRITEGFAFQYAEWLKPSEPRS